MNDQIQTTQPDFGFIVNQPDPVRPKKSKKPLVIGAVLVVLVLVGLGSVLLANSRVKQSTTTPGSTQTDKPTTPEQTANLLVSYLGKNDDTLDVALVSYLGKNLTISKEVNTAFFRRMQAYIDFSTCTPGPSKKNPTSEEFVYNCKTHKGNQVNFTVITAQEDGKIVITAHRIEYNGKA